MLRGLFDLFFWLIRHPSAWFKQRGSSKVRLFPILLTLSAGGLVGVAVQEDYRGKAYNDGVGVQTIGFGSTTHPDGSPVKRGDTTTPPRALVQLHNHVAGDEARMRTCIGDVPLYQHEWDAYVSLAYNIGIGKSGVSDGFCYAKRGGYSGLVTALRQTPPDYPGACAQILRWNKGGGRVMPGLVKRREAEYRICVGNNESLKSGASLPLLDADSADGAEK